MKIAQVAITEIKTKLSREALRYSKQMSTYFLYFSGKSKHVLYINFINSKMPNLKQCYLDISERWLMSN